MATNTKTFDRTQFELALGDELVRIHESGPTPATAPAETIDVSVYTDPERHAREVSAWSRRPVAVAAASELTEPGSIITTQLGATPVVITRDHDGKLHAMINACAHRGATVVTAPADTGRLMSCNFHGWSYNLDGSLRSVSTPDLFSTTPCSRGLTRLPTEERHGMVWVTTADSIDVRGFLGDELDEMFDGLGMGEMVAHRSITYDLACNWKMLTDGFLEIYHLKYLHRDSIAPYFPANGMTSRRVGPHFLGALPKNRLVRDLLELPRDQWDVLNGLTMTVTLVPGSVVQWQAGHVEFFSIFPHPDDPTRSSCRLTMLVPTDRRDETELWDRNWERVCDTIPNEDFAAAVDVQRNVSAGAITQLQIGANEHKLVEHLEAVDTLIRADA